MKFLLVISLMLLLGCSSNPVPHVGDCIWTEYRVFKITAEGKYTFELIDESGEKYTTHTKNFEPVDCFDRVFKEKKK